LSLELLIGNVIMYWIIDGACFCSGIVCFTLLILNNYASLCWIGLLWVVLYPLLLEGVFNLVAGLSAKQEYTVKVSSRFVYSPDYNITFCGIEKCHPFDSQKYGNIYRFLLDRGLIREGEAIVPQKAPRGLLLESMSKCYLLKQCYTVSICSYIEMPLFLLPAFLLRWRVLDPMLTATEGSILAVCAAMRLGWTVNLSGGFHHASFDEGGGFCVYPDISLAVHYLRTRLGVRRVMIVDLDAHQGNGHEKDHLGDP
jgi:histone deacetylase 11